MQRRAPLHHRVLRLSLLLLTCAFPALASDPPASPRQVNITSDSEPGWIPTEQEEATARETALAYLAAEDSDRAADAFALVADDEKLIEPFPAFSARLASFDLLAGEVVERRIVAVTWTRNSKTQPEPGTYVAIDVASRFSKIDRHCGYLVLYRPPNASVFRVAREEQDFIENATAQKMTTGELDKTWSQLSSRCPNYPGLVAANPLPPIPESSDASIGYPTVAAALADLRSKPGVVFSTQQGWTVAKDEAAENFWSFPPEGHPAYPAAVRRHLIQKDGAISMKMTVLCQASKAACDDLVRSFEELNARMSQDLQGRR